MADGLTMDEGSLRKLSVNIKHYSDEVEKASTAGLRKLGLRIVARGKEILKENDNVVTGLLRNSGRVLARKDGTVDAGFEANYAADIEYGRKSGTRPPAAKIYEWLAKKRIIPRKSGEKKDITKSRWALAYAISNSIFEKGTAGHPFLGRAYKEIVDTANTDIQGEINKVNIKTNNL